MNVIVPAVPTEEMVLAGQGVSSIAENGAQACRMEIKGIYQAILQARPMRDEEAIWRTAVEAFELRGMSGGNNYDKLSAALIALGLIAESGD